MGVIILFLFSVCVQSRQHFNFIFLNNTNVKVETVLSFLSYEKSSCNNFCTQRDSHVMSFFFLDKTLDWHGERKKSDLGRHVGHCNSVIKLYFPRTSGSLKLDYIISMIIGKECLRLQIWNTNECGKGNLVCIQWPMINSVLC